MNITVKTTKETNWKEIAENPVLGAVITDTLKNGQEIKYEIAATGVYGAAAAVVCYDCLPEQWAMNKEWTNKGGYNPSEMRRHLREDILPLLPDELRAVIVPRAIKQKINGKIVEGGTPDEIWLPSVTEMFGDDLTNDPRTGDYEDVHFNLYSTEKSRVKECGDNGTWFYWLRSPYTGYTNFFWCVYGNGSVTGSIANGAYGVAFGFLINP